MFVIDLRRIKLLYPIPYRYITPLFSSLNGSNALEVLRKLRPRKYKYKEYITTIKVDVLFLRNLTINY
jgi:hypothetical protein